MLVLPLLLPRDHVGFAGQDRADEARDVLGLVLQIRGIEHEHVAARVEIPRTQRVGDPAAGGDGGHARRNG